MSTEAEKLKLRITAYIRKASARLYNQVLYKLQNMESKFAYATFLRVLLWIYDMTKSLMS